MVYTVKKLAQLSKVSIRTLHFYDEIGLLRPAYYGANGYRQYEEAQLLVLQQILFFKELGFELKKIQKVLGRSDFDQITALSSHRQLLQKNLEKTKKLIQTIDKTIEHLKGLKKMKDQEIFQGFNKEKQAEYEKYLIDRFGDEAKKAIEEAKKNEKNSTPAELEKFRDDWIHLCNDLADLKGKYQADSPEVQKVIERHFNWIKRAWTPNRESYIGLGQGYTEFEWKKAFLPYDPNHPQLALFLAEGMKIFAERELS